MAQHGSLSFNGPGPAENTSAGTTLISFFAGERSRDPKERFSIFWISRVLTTHHSFQTEHHGRDPRLQETLDSFGRPSLISELAEVWKNQREHLGHRNTPLSPPQGGDSLVQPFGATVWRCTTWYSDLQFKFQLPCLLAGLPQSAFPCLSSSIWKTNY